MTHKPLSPTPADLIIASALAERVVAAGLNRVRRVVLIGSRARGDARANSDLDIVVLVETARGARRWGGKEFGAERERIQREVGRPSIRTDLWVRTTDRYEEARRVIGGVEHLIDVEGVDVHSEPLHRPPEVRSTAAQVRRDHTYGWIRHAMDTLENAFGSQTGAGASGATKSRARRPEAAARDAIERAINAMLVSRGAFGSKRDGTSGMLSKLAATDLKSAAQLHEIACTRPHSLQVANATLQYVVSRIAEDPETLPLLSVEQRRLSALPPSQSRPCHSSADLTA